MNTRFAALLIAGIASLAACGGGGGGTTPPSPGGGGGSTPPPGVGAQTIGMALPSGAIGMVNTSPFGLVGGYTQTVYSQVIAFPPGTTITLKNLSSNTPHTLNVLSTTGFPSNPSLSTTASGGTSLGTNFASGAIAPGATMSITLSTPGTYYIGCAFHYASNGMRDVVMVSASATPGPQATPQPSTGGGGGGGGY